MRYLLTSVLILALAACTGSRVVSRQDAWTGFQQSYTSEYEIFSDRKAIMVVRPIMISRDGVQAFGVLTNIRRRVANGPIVETMTSRGVPLQYERHDRLLTHCIDGCQRAEVGIIKLTPAAFRLAARTGLPIRVQGRRGRYEGTVPGWLFQRVLAGAQ
ncbi:hypothetical protein [Yoonia sp. SS1-5]|uniref:Uncharacterized protein n=1 Tax=Yoonia rhodophyticola TaxID=3137370 RepID=A0AAN0NJ91_9RHOB